MLNDDTLVEVTTNHVSTNTEVPMPPPLNVSTNTNTQTLAPKVPITPPITLAPRISARPIHTPGYLKDYTYTLPNLHSSKYNPYHSLTSFISYPDHVCFTSLGPSSQQLINNISHDIEPPSYEEAILNPVWQVEMTQEFNALCMQMILGN